METGTYRITRIEHTLYPGNFTSDDDVDAYADYLETYLQQRYPEAEVNVHIARGHEGPPPRVRVWIADADPDDSEAEYQATSEVEMALEDAADDFSRGL